MRKVVSLCGNIFFMSSFNYRRLKDFDNTGLFSSTNETSYFPFHYHELFCVTLIREGVEILETTTGQLITTAGTVSVIPPGEMHRNYSLTDTGYSYETMYLNPELLQFFNGGKPVPALERTITDPLLFTQLHALFLAEPVDQQAWSDSLRLLCQYAVASDTVYGSSSRFRTIDELVEEYPEEVSDNEWLSKQFHMSLYHFIREFKRAHGVTPQRYVLIKKLNTAKKLLLQDIPIKDIAYLTGFCDPSHFVNSFKKIYGLSPGAFGAGAM
jgi:AraC-like DNA-binding protein